MNLFSKKIIFFYFSVFILALAGSANAVTFSAPSKIQSFPDLLFNILKVLLFISLPIAVLLIIYGAFILLKSSGEENQRAKAKNIILWAVIGLIIVGTANGISGLFKNISKSNIEKSVPTISATPYFSFPDEIKSNKIEGDYWIAESKATQALAEKAQKSGDTSLAIALSSDANKYKEKGNSLLIASKNLKKEFDYRIEEEKSTYSPYAPLLVSVVDQNDDNNSTLVNINAEGVKDLISAGINAVKLSKEEYSNVMYSLSKFNKELLDTDEKIKLAGGDIEKIGALKDYRKSIIELKNNALADAKDYEIKKSYNDYLSVLPYALGNIIITETTPAMKTTISQLKSEYASGNLSIPAQEEMLKAGIISKTVTPNLKPRPLTNIELATLNAETGIKNKGYYAGNSSTTEENKQILSALTGDQLNTIEVGGTQYLMMTQDNATENSGNNPKIPFILSSQSLTKSDTAMQGKTSETILYSVNIPKNFELTFPDKTTFKWNGNVWENTSTGAYPTKEQAYSMNEHVVALVYQYQQSQALKALRNDPIMKELNSRVGEGIIQGFAHTIAGVNAGQAIVGLSDAIGLTASMNNSISAALNSAAAGNYAQANAHYADAINSYSAIVAISNSTNTLANQAYGTVAGAHPHDNPARVTGLINTFAAMRDAQQREQSMISNGQNALDTVMAVLGNNYDSSNPGTASGGISGNIGSGLNGIAVSFFGPVNNMMVTTIIGGKEFSGVVNNDTTPSNPSGINNPHSVAVPITNLNDPGNSGYYAILSYTSISPAAAGEAAANNAAAKGLNATVAHTAASNAAANGVSAENSAAAGDAAANADNAGASPTGINAAAAGASQGAPIGVAVSAGISAANSVPAGVVSSPASGAAAGQAGVVAYHMGLTPTQSAATGTAAAGGSVTSSLHAALSTSIIMTTVPGIPAEAAIASGAASNTATAGTSPTQAGITAALDNGATPAQAQAAGAISGAISNGATVATANAIGMATLATFGNDGAGAANNAGTAAGAGASPASAANAATAAGVPANVAAAAGASGFLGSRGLMNIATLGGNSANASVSSAGTPAGIASTLGVLAAIAFNNATIAFNNGGIPSVSLGGITATVTNGAPTGATPAGIAGAVASVNGNNVANAVHTAIAVQVTMSLGGNPTDAANINSNGDPDAVTIGLIANGIGINNMLDANIGAPVDTGTSGNGGNGSSSPGSGGGVSGNSSGSVGIGTADGGTGVGTGSGGTSGNGGNGSSSPGSGGGVSGNSSGSVGIGTADGGTGVGTGSGGTSGNGGNGSSSPGSGGGVSGNSSGSVGIGTADGGTGVGTGSGGTSGNGGGTGGGGSGGGGGGAVGGGGGDGGAAPAGSCPFVYSWDGVKWNFDHESFPFAVTKAGETTSYGRLENLKSIDGKLKLQIREQLPETSWTDFADIYSVEHPGNSIVMPDINGEPHTIQNKIIPETCTAKNNDGCLDLVKSSDEKFWTSNLNQNFQNPENYFDWVDLDFSKPADAKNVKIGLNLMKSGAIDWAWQYLINETGKNNFPLFENLFTKIPFLNKQWLKTRDLNWRINVEIWNGNNWTNAGTVEVGREKWNDTLVFADISNIKTGDLKIRLKGTSGFYEINSVFVDYSQDEPMNINKLEVLSAVKNNAVDVKNLLANKDENYVEMNQGDSINLELRDVLTNSDWNKDYLVKIRGYYHFRDFTENQSFLHFLKTAKDIIFPVLYKEGFEASYFMQKYVEALSTRLIK